jgi:hypothetical protein
VRASYTSVRRQSAVRRFRKTNESATVTREAQFNFEPYGTSAVSLALIAERSSYTNGVCLLYADLAGHRNLYCNGHQSIMHLQSVRCIYSFSILCVGGSKINRYSSDTSFTAATSTSFLQPVFRNFANSTMEQQLTVVPEINHRFHCHIAVRDALSLL